MWMTEMSVARRLSVIVLLLAFWHNADPLAAQSF